MSQGTNRNRRVFQLESLESRIALSGFGEQVSDQAQDPSQLTYPDGSHPANFGQWQSDHAHDGGLGQDNNAQTGSAKLFYNGPPGGPKS
jgi:hypothetical protein